MTKTAAAFLHYSLSPIGYRYDSLTSTERTLCTAEEYATMVAEVLAMPCPANIEACPCGCHDTDETAAAPCVNCICPREWVGRV